MSEIKRVPNDGTGNCDNCGNELKKTKWISGESTGCSKKCVEQDLAADDAEFFHTLHGGADNG